MWLEAIDLVLRRLKDDGLDFSLVKGMSGAGMQHGTVFWSKDAEQLLKELDPKKSLVEQLDPESGKNALSHPHSPNWQDASTQKQCDAFDAELGGQETLANITGSKAHHRFSGPQIMRWHTKYPEEWKNTARISLVSSFLCSVFLGRFAPIDISDVTGMNLWDVKAGKWHEKMLALAAGKEGPESLKARLGEVFEDGGAPFGTISKYFTERYGFSPDCKIVPFTGDNPSTILSLPLRASDAMVSLGTSTTFLMSTPHYLPDPDYHFMNHPTTAGLYMFMLCYKNGGLAREHVRDSVNGGSKSDKSWDKFNKIALDTPPLAQKSDKDPMRMGLYFPRPEIVPNLPAGQWRYEYQDGELKQTSAEFNEADARGIVESQFLSLRLRSAKLVAPHKSDEKSKAQNHLPPQPRRVYLVGGGSVNPAIARICGDVLGGIEGIYRLDIGGNACALGSAYKAVWGCERKDDKETFEQLIGERWDEEAFVKKIADGYREGVFEKYGEALKGFDKMEDLVVDEHASDDVHKGGVVMKDEHGHGAHNP